MVDPSRYIFIIRINRMFNLCTEACDLVVDVRFPCLCHLGSSLSVHVCHPAVSYLSTGLAGCSVDPRISCGACKLARTPRVKKKIEYLIFYVKEIKNKKMAQLMDRAKFT